MTIIGDWIGEMGEGEPRNFSPLSRSGDVDKTPAVGVQVHEMSR